MTPEAWIALIGGTAGGSALTAVCNFVLARSKQKSDDRHDATVLTNEDRAKFIDTLMKRLETVETEVKACREQHAECQKGQVEQAGINGRLEGQVIALTALVKQQVSPHISIHSGEKLVETIGIEPPQAPEE